LISPAADTQYGSLERATGLRLHQRGVAAPSSELFWGRVRRAFRRQIPTFLLTAAGLAALVLLYQTLVGAEPEMGLPASIAIGAAGGLAAALVRELGRNTITSLSSFGRHRGFGVLGAAPELTPRALRELAPDHRSRLGCLAYAPASPFATAFRDLQGALARERVAAIIASFPGEGATTVALCAAASAAQQGRRVVVVDCDLRRRSLTQALSNEPRTGVLEASERPEYWRDHVKREPETGLYFVPAAAPASPWRTLTGAPGFRALLRRLREEFDLVVLDCPPALASAEGPVIARLADRCVLVSGWDRTPLSAIRAAMRALRARSTAVYVNRVPPGYRFGRLRPD
jgi:Mrp family chromosome partitioning ATPase